MKILANDGISKNAIELLEKSGFEVLDIQVSQEQLANYINKNQVAILLVRSSTNVQKDIIDNCPSLKLIGRAGVGMDNIDVDYAEENEIKVINTPEASSRSVAEIVFAHLFTGIRFLQDSNRNMPLDGDTKFNHLKKNYGAGRELSGKTLGIIGFGKVGKEVAKIALGCGMKVIAGSRTTGQEEITLDFYDGQKISVKIDRLPINEALKESDFISLHVPAGADYLIGSEEIGMMKDGVGIINTARGGVLDERALLEALEAGKISFAGLDVFEDEPKPAIQILMHDKISLSPHIGASTLEAQERIGMELANQIIRIFT